MKMKSLVAAIVSASLMTTTPALAQPADEGVSGVPWAAWLVLAGVTVGWILLIIDDDDDNDVPASP